MNKLSNLLTFYFIKPINFNAKFHVLKLVSEPSYEFIAENCSIERNEGHEME